MNNVSPILNNNQDNNNTYQRNEALKNITKLSHWIPGSEMSLGKICEINPINADDNNNNFGNDTNVNNESPNDFPCDGIDDTELIKDINMNDSFN